MPRTVDEPPPRSKAGRPPRINREMIAEAAHDIGLEGLTVRAVADHLGVTTAALYHHVQGRDDLLRLAADQSARAFPHPVDHGQHWAQWLLDWANYNHAVFTAQPGLLGQYLAGTISLDAVVRDLDVILGVLVREGFTVDEANEAYGLVSACALGTILTARWEHASTGETGDVVATYRQVVDAAPKARLVHVRKLLSLRGYRRPTFEHRIEVVLRGIAVDRGLRWKPVVHHEAPPARRP